MVFASETGIVIHEVKKEEVEQLLKCSITDEQFTEALEMAVRKRAYIYSRDKRPVILQHWYLVKLTEEYVRNLAFSRYTSDLCEMRDNMKKERSVNDRSTPITNHIVPQQTA